MDDETTPVGELDPSYSPISSQSTLERLRKRRREEAAAIHAEGSVAQTRHSAFTAQRPVELAMQVRNATRGGELLVATLVDVALGLEPMPVVATHPETGERVVRIASGTPTASDRVRAAGMLKVWGWGKEVEHVAIDATVRPAGSSEPTFDMDKLSADDLVAYLDLSRKARGAVAALPPANSEQVVDGQCEVQPTETHESQVENEAKVPVLET